jgi:hypothetical protein
MEVPVLAPRFYFYLPDFKEGYKLKVKQMKTDSTGFGLGQGKVLAVILQRHDVEKKANYLQKLKLAFGSGEWRPH